MRCRFVQRADRRADGGLHLFFVEPPRGDKATRRDGNLLQAGHLLRIVRIAVEDHLFAAAARAARVRRDVVGDRKQPGRKLGPRLVTLARTIDAQEHILGQVLGRVRANLTKCSSTVTRRS